MPGGSSSTRRCAGVLPARGRESEKPAQRIRVPAVDQAPIRDRHIALPVVLLAAITIDVMKPAMSSSGVPGVAHESVFPQRRAPSAALCPNMASAPLT